MKEIKTAVILSFMATIITSIAFGLTVFSDFPYYKQAYCGGAIMPEDYKPTEYLTPLDHPGQIVFKSNCTTCHSLDIKIISPPLRNVFEYRDSLWTVKMIKNARKLRENGDSLAIANFEGYNHLQHTSFEIMPDSTLKLLISYLIEEGNRDSAQN
ncbi:c-type cytochrome [Marinigracilibium pacificum]|uniref:Cytochrome c n=1 Tax=Marinigracilibium pacificum TaxID=2729599 RepID=A0A848ITN0_9BACT|nr:c-type cytochrome [Marinigracilibium pacificum]NMM47843.1 cytochrome c [Marinigracilibium pacificum]